MGLVQLVVSISFATLINLSTPSQWAFDVCMGKLDSIYLNESNGHKVCYSGESLLQVSCKIVVIIHSVVASNIPEAFLLYACFKYIRRHIDSSQSILGERQFEMRKQGIIYYAMKYI